MEIRSKLIKKWPSNIRMLYSSANVMIKGFLDGSLFHFYQSQPEHEKKGKINLKAYCFELDSDEDMSYSQM